ncbi:hypothetical protein IQ268_14915 [Oculatella sp. LEGE 06141]|uniref:hypothetical protein n=1 Tax=Oculatella sp. LEGE 06141 TaxID=1828648 RepID=UPI00187FB753|nr:hypothetical protein [Oculatella sp. LEGE 06141]MBE9179860.1 hypothetical protein [Oculatella sp. LEGE 06141]
MSHSAATGALSEGGDGSWAESGGSGVGVGVGVAASGTGCVGTDGELVTGGWVGLEARLKHPDVSATNAAATNVVRDLAVVIIASKVAPSGAE